MITFEYEIIGFSKVLQVNGIESLNNIQLSH